MLRYFLFCFFCIFILVPNANSSDFILKIDGLPLELKKFFYSKLSSIVQDKVIADSHFYAKIDKVIRSGLKSLGYYEPNIKYFYKNLQSSFKSILSIKIDPGQPIYVKDIKITLKGPAKYDKDYIEIITYSKSQKGMILNHSNYEKLKNKFNQLAVSKGYFDAEMEKSQLGVSLTNRTSYWIFNFNSGQRYRFGTPKYNGSQILEDYLNSIIPFKYGDYYFSEKLLKFNQQLFSTGWFDSVIVTPNLSKAREEGLYILPLDVELIPRARNNLELGIGYSTNIGFRIKSVWNKPWINNRGYSFISNFSFSQFEQMFNINYKIPLQKNPLEQYYIIQMCFKHKNINDIRYNTIIFNLLRHWDYYEDWQYGINLYCNFNHFVQNKIVNTTMILYPSFTFSRIRKLDNSILFQVDSQQYSIDISNTIWNSNVNFIILQAQNLWVRTPWKKHRFIIKSHLGWIETNQFNKIPLDLRFFINGNYGVRGYSYQKNIFINNQEKLIGASKLAIFSFEYQYNIISNGWGAIFIDGGDATNSFNKNNIKIGAGVGIRWNLPIGTIKLDIATPVGDDYGYSKIQFYIGLGA